MEIESGQGGDVRRVRKDHARLVDELFSQERMEDFVAKFPAGDREKLKKSIFSMSFYFRSEALPLDLFEGKRVLDWEAGLGNLSMVLLFLGASEVVAIDSWVPATNIPVSYFDSGKFYYEQAPIEGFKEGILDNPDKMFDVVFSNTVTEHIQNIPYAFDCVRDVLKSDGYYFNVHDNYYSPCGSHDHGFWFYGKGGRVEFQGAKCWESADKCAASAEHRTKLLTNVPWTWNAALDSRRDPSNCRKCPYWVRSQPWAHLRSASKFRDVYADKSFFSQRESSVLNKLTTFQVGQFLNEAGFDIIKLTRNRCNNPVEPDMLEMGFSSLELTTTTSMWFAAKGTAPIARASRFSNQR
jgi:2-polyprenyl-6-hydroxyphenyl methylase/3-demethylubiquinone-9 3-methyltransferase